MNTTIEHYLKRLENGDWALVMPNSYDRSMTFCRVNEFYSGAKEFKGRYFTLFDFMRAFSLENGNVFFYTADEKEFTLPFPVVKLWCETLINNDEIHCISPHEKILFDAWDEIESIVGKENNFSLKGLKTA